MTMAATAATPVSTKNRRETLRHQAKTNRAGQIAKPVPKLKEATKPATSRMRVAGHTFDPSARIFGRGKTATARLAVPREHIELNPPGSVIAPRAIQKLLTTTTIVVTIFVVRPTVSS